MARRASPPTSVGPPQVRHRRLAATTRLAVRLLLHEPLAELGAAAVGVEAADEDVAVRRAVRVAGLADRHRGVAVDRQRAVLRLPRARLVLVLGPLADDRLAPDD